MKLGVRAHDYGKHTVKQYAQLLHKQGFQAAQVAIPKAFTGIDTFEDITEDLLYEIRDEFGKNNIEISILGCYVDLSNPEKDMRMYAVETFKKGLQYAKILGAKLTGTETSYAQLSLRKKAEYYPYMVESLKEITEEAAKLESYIGLETVVSHPLYDVQMTQELLEWLDCKYLKLIFDPANVLERPCEVIQSRYWKRCFDTLGEAIEVIHLKDFTVDRQGNYYPVRLGEGVMEFDAIKEWLAVHPDVPVLREEIVPENTKTDLEFMKSLFDEKC